MQLLIKKASQILDAPTASQRGILITILLLREKDPELTLAKVKKKLKIAKVRQDLVSLHEMGYIRWSEYSKAKKILEKEQTTPEVIEIIDFMNGLYKRKFNPKTSAYNTPLRERLKEHSVDDIKKVIANRYIAWKDDSIMSKHLNPETIFRKSKFDKYLEEALRTKEGESFLAAEKIDLKYGDEITYEIAQGLSDDDTYVIRVYQTDGQGNKRGNGIKSTRYGRDIKRVLFVENKKIQRGELKEYTYIYANK
jgi:uncharacterized phage protein (TIGR02220 family)